MLDSHLVMNVLNLMAARDFREHGREDPLLFALSDYLQEAFQLSNSERFSVADELRLMKVQVLLAAEVRGGAIDVQASAGDAAGRLVWPGSICGVANLLLKLGDGPRGRGGRLRVRLTDAAGPASGDGGGLAVAMDFWDTAGPDAAAAQRSGTHAAAAFDLAAARRRWGGVFADLRPPQEAPLAKWSQDQPAHVRLDFILPAF